MLNKIVYHIVIFAAILVGAFEFHQRTIVSGKEDTQIETPITQSSPPCIQMYYAIEKYSEAYGIPKKYAYGLAYSETRYRGPFDWAYTAERISPVSAQGPMQIMLATAKLMWPGRNITEKELRCNIDFNVETSMKCIKHLHEVYGDWKLAFGAYNTGRPMVNQYAMDVYSYKHENTIPNF